MTLARSLLAAGLLLAAPAYAEDDPYGDLGGRKPEKEEQPERLAQLPQDGSDLVVLLQAVRFRTGTAELETISRLVLGEVADLLKAHPEFDKVVVEGHTDSVGSAAANKALSQERAEAVRTVLIEQGIPAGRLVAIGYGEERPIVEATDAMGHARNRRVEFRLGYLEPPPDAVAPR